MFDPPPITVVPNVVTVASDTKVLLPAFVVDAAGSLATVVIDVLVMYASVNMPSTVFIWFKNKRKTLVSLSPYCRSYSSGARGMLGTAGLIGFVAIICVRLVSC